MAPDIENTKEIVTRLGSHINNLDDAQKEAIAELQRTVSELHAIAFTRKVPSRWEMMFWMFLTWFIILSR